MNNVPVNSDTHVDTREMHMIIMKSINLKASGEDMEEPLYSGLDVLPDDRLVVVDSTNKLYMSWTRI